MSLPLSSIGIMDASNEGYGGKTSWDNFWASY